MPTLTAARPAAPVTPRADCLTRALAIASSRDMRITGTAKHSRRVADLAARPSSLPMERAAALDELAAGAGTQFDPQVVGAFNAALRSPVHRAA